MTTQSVFWALVKHDLRRRKRRNVARSKTWVVLYGTVIAALVVIVATYVSLSGQRVDLTDAWVFTYVLPFMSFGLTIGLLVHEWKDGTAGWWLSLPMSRLRLVTSKFVAALIRMILLVAAVYCATGLLILYTMVLEGNFNAHTAGQFLLTGLKYDGLFLCVCPFIAAFGVLIGVLTESRAKPIMPLIWLVFGCSWWLIFSWHGGTVHIQHTHGLAGFSLAPIFYYLIVASWIVAYLMIRLTSYVLERQMAS
ncbi:ABC transporter permease subunit [Alicyclobacillus fodiniaquatilis]|uniref:ABC transporter permease subunit n=1 Tax=Alicyclobacillus fodiniaquatilis TaxID=1661150 RepID=A0ABW4JM73_9BACL